VQGSGPSVFKLPSRTVELRSSVRNVPSRAMETVLIPSCLPYSLQRWPPVSPFSQSLQQPLRRPPSSPLFLMPPPSPHRARARAPSRRSEKPQSQLTQSNPARLRSYPPVLHPRHVHHRPARRGERYPAFAIGWNGFVVAFRYCDSGFGDQGESLLVLFCRHGSAPATSSLPHAPSLPAPPYLSDVCSFVRFAC
jgi:hypothetical protein